MKKFLVAVGMTCAVVIGLGLGSAALGNGRLRGDETAMAVSPHCIVLSEIEAVTVHTNIPRGTVDDSTVTLNGVAPFAIWADDCGHLAARFLVADLALEPADAVTMTLCGVYGSGASAGETFSPEDVVRVKD